MNVLKCSFKSKNFFS